MANQSERVEQDGDGWIVWFRPSGGAYRFVKVNDDWVMMTGARRSMPGETARRRFFARGIAAIDASERKTPATCAGV